MHKLKVLIILIIFSGIGFFLYKQFIAKDTSDVVLQNLLNDPYVKGKLTDISKMSGISSVDDIAYYEDEFGNLNVRYGNQEFAVPKKALTKDMIYKLKELGLELYKDKKTGHLIMKYKGERVKEWIIKDAAS